MKNLHGEEIRPGIYTDVSEIVLSFRPSHSELYEVVNTPQGLLARDSEGRELQVIANRKVGEIDYLSREELAQRGKVCALNMYPCNLVKEEITRQLRVSQERAPKLLKLLERAQSSYHPANQTVCDCCEDAPAIDEPYAGYG